MNATALLGRARRLLTSSIQNAAMKFDFAAIGPFSMLAIVLFAILLLIAVMAALAVLLRQVAGNLKVDTGHSYEAVPLFTPAEQSFFGVLQQAIASDYRIFAKVRLADVIHPVRGISRSGWQSAFNRIIGKHIDFVLCDPQTLRVVLVIELDDKTHKRFERGIRDGMVDAALAGAGIAVLRVPAARAYSLVQIQQQIESLIRLPAQTR